jgi:SAM-dependent methyltransferase
MFSPPSDKDFKAALDDHLRWWGLRRFESDEAYFRWQRQTLSPGELIELNRLVEQKRGDISAERAFYDLTAHPRILPVLYSQRYDFYLAVGAAVAARIARQHAAWQTAGSATGPTASALDFGCGIGVLTTFYAKQFPDLSFVGIDRSEASLGAARQRAEALHLTNVRFERSDVPREAITGSYHLILSTHALLQAEQEPGLPSRDWRTFDRDHDPAAQAAFEARTGLDARLDQLCAALAPEGRLVVFEKTRLLARRVAFQRALAARGLRLCEPPVPIRYHIVEEVSDDGPLYVLDRGASRTDLAWDESPELDDRDRLDQAELRSKPVVGDQPLYENHAVSAQRAWARLQGRQVLRETTRDESDGRQFHVELGTVQGLTYLYQATNFDQRQLVVMDRERTGLLEDYYRELVAPAAGP